MVPDLTLEVIYLNQPTDFKMEFELCGSSNIRFLSLPVKSRSEFLQALSKSVIRSRAIVTIGSFNPLDKDYIPKIIAKATGYELQAVENEKFGIQAQEVVLLPENSLPLVDSDGNLGGCVLENNDQSIIMLTSERQLRHSIVTNLVCPYLKIFAVKKNDVNQNTMPPVTNTAVENTPMDEDNAQKPIQDKADEPLNINEGEDVQTQYSVIEQPDLVEQPNSGEQASLDEQLNLPHQSDANNGNEFNMDAFLIDDDYNKDNHKSKKRRPFIKIIISIILVLAVLLASYFGYDRLFQPMQRNSVYEEIKNLYGQKWSELPEDVFYKFGKLYQTNSDIFGWISIPNTSISLPIVSVKNKSAAYYRSHLFEGSVNRYGTLYTTAKNNADYNRNIVVYGKNTGDGVMFSELDMFLDIENYKEVPSFTFDTLYFENKWKIFSVFKINSKNREDYLKTNFFDDADFSNYIELIRDVSAIETNIDVTYSDQIVTLVSLGESFDVILVARKVRDGESPMVDVTGVTENHTATDSSDIPVVADPLKPIEGSSEQANTSEFIDQNMVDGASSRYEQQSPVNSFLEIKPTVPTITSVPEIPSQKPSSSSVTTSNKSSSSKVSSNKQPSTSSAVSSNSPISNKLPMLTVTNTFNGAKVKGEALDIIAQNIEAEMGSSYEMEALKAQAVAAYSWLLNNGSAEDKYPNLPLKTPSQKCINAVNAVAGQVAVYGGKVATTFYYAISAGKTAYAQDIWGGSYPHLVSVDSSVDKNVKGFQTVRKYSADEISQKAKKLLNVDLTKISDKNKWFTCSYDVNGLYCTKVKIGSIEKKGTYLRDTFFNYDLRSSAYTIAYNQSEDNFIFTVKGYGHGVGMSQTGANQYAKSGWNYEKILKHYFTGITLGTYYVN